MGILPPDKESLAIIDINTLIGQTIDIKLKLNNTSFLVASTKDNLKLIIQVCDRLTITLRGERESNQYIAGLMENASGMKTLTKKWQGAASEEQRDNMFDEMVNNARTYIKAMINALSNLGCNVQELRQRIKDL